jgi:lysophospholipase L1-like esterase
MASRFPIKTALALATAVAALAAYHFLADPTKGLNPNLFADVVHFDLIRHPPRAAAAAPPPPPVSSPAKPSARPPISPYLIDDSGALDPFYAQLRSLELPPDPATRQPQVATVLHYGDSPTTADLITGDVRELLQQRFGDAGHGYLLTAKPWAWYQHRNVDIADHDWKISTAVGKGREEVYGLGGASFEGTSSAGSHITLHDDDGTPQTTVELDYLARPDGGSLTVKANDATIDTLATASPTETPAWATYQLPADTKTIDLSPTGPVRLFGETLRTGDRGILYDSLGLNGASTSVLSNGFNAAAWSAELKHTQPALIVINYGTNESGFGTYVDKQYEPTLRITIKRIRAALPTVPILIMSPMDRGRRTGVDEIETYDTIPRLIAIQKRVAAEQKCAFFDTFNAMGGDGTMSRWYTGHPRLVAGDLIHPTPQGASIVAQLFVKDLLLGYDRYLRLHPDGKTVPKPAPPQATPAAAPSSPTQHAVILNEGAPSTTVSDAVEGGSTLLPRSRTRSEGPRVLPPNHRARKLPATTARLRRTHKAKVRQA